LNVRDYLRDWLFYWYQDLQNPEYVNSNNSFAHLKIKRVIDRLTAQPKDNL